MFHQLFVILSPLSQLFYTSRSGQLPRTEIGNVSVERMSGASRPSFIDRNPESIVQGGTTLWTSQRYLSILNLLVRSRFQGLSCFSSPLSHLQDNRILSSVFMHQSLKLIHQFLFLELVSMTLRKRIAVPTIHMYVKLTPKSWVCLHASTASWKFQTIII